MRKIYTLLTTLFFIGFVNAQEWNITSASFNALGTITTTTTVEGLTIYATESATVIVDANDKTLDDISYNYRLKLGGSGTFTDGEPISRILAFDVDGPKTISIICMSSSSSADRTLTVSAGSNDNIIGTASASGTALTRTDINYTAEAAETIYIFSPSSGVNIYHIIVTDYSPTAISQPTVNSNVTSVEYYSITGAKMGNDWNVLPIGVYIVKKTYDNGETVTEKISKTRR